MRPGGYKLRQYVAGLDKIGGQAAALSGPTDELRPTHLETDMKRTLLAGGIAAIVITGVAVAAPGDRAARFDPNGDGKVTVAEMQQRSEARFGKLDADSDGRVTRAEADAVREQGRAGRGGMRGKGGDVFARMDANGDGALTRTEFESAREQRREKRAERRASRGEHEGDHARHRRGHRGARGDFIARMDGNGDGAVTLAEFSARSAERLQRLDADRDGEVTREEFSAVRAARKATRDQAD